MGIKAAIHDYEMRGDHTLITKLIAETTAEHDFRKAIFSVYNFDSQIMAVAAFSKIVSDAAKQGDPIASEIIRENAYLLAMQTISLIKMHPNALQTSILAAGGNFKCYQLFYWFQKYVLELYPDADVRKPIFEPVVGGVVAYILEENILFSEQLRKKLETNFNKFVSLI